MVLKTVQKVTESCVAHAHEMPDLTIATSLFRGTISSQLRPGGLVFRPSRFPSQDHEVHPPLSRRRVPCR